MKPTLALAATLVAVLFSPAHAAIGDWVESDNARMRLVAAGIGPDGQLAAAIEIELAPDWKTYWRNPGDAGIPPVIDFSASKNLGDPVVDFPVPHRFDDGFGISNVYTDHVVLPLKAKIAAASADTTLAVSLDIGTCQEVCVPEHFDAEISVPKGEADADAAAIIADGRKTVPGAAVPGTLAAEAARRDGGTDRKPEFLLTAVAPDPKAAEVYVEAPADWYAGAPEFVSAQGAEGTWRLTFDRPDTSQAIAGSSIRITIVAGGRAVDQTIALD